MCALDPRVTETVRLRRVERGNLLNQAEPMFFTSTLRKVLHVQLDLAGNVCFRSACYRNGASAYGIFITVIYVQAAGLNKVIAPPPFALVPNCCKK